MLRYITILRILLGSTSFAAYSHRSIESATPQRHQGEVEKYISNMSMPGRMVCTQKHGKAHLECNLYGAARRPKKLMSNFAHGFSIDLDPIYLQQNIAQKQHSRRLLKQKVSGTQSKKQKTTPARSTDIKESSFAYPCLCASPCGCELNDRTRLTNAMLPAPPWERLMTRRAP